MEKVYLVIAEYYSDVVYGVDSRRYLCGCYATEEEARSRIDFLETETNKAKRDYDDCKKTMANGDYKKGLNAMISLFKRARKILGFSIRPMEEVYCSLWDVKFVIRNTPFGDIKRVTLSNVQYAE